MEFVSHKISFSNSIYSKDGEIDAEDEGLNFLRFRNQGDVNITVNSEIIAPKEEVSYGVNEDSNDIIGIYKYTFDTTAGSKQVLITKGKRVKSVVLKASKSC